MWTFLSRRRELKILGYRIIMRQDGKNTIIIKVIRRG